MRYFVGGFVGMIAAMAIILGWIWIMAIYIPIPTGPEKYLVFSGMIAAGLVILLAMVIVGAIFS